MTSPLPAQIRANPGSPASVRVGTIVSVSPLQVSLQGTVLNDVGLSGSYSPQLGDSVVLLGQSSAAGPDPASWVALGKSTPQGLQILYEMATAPLTLGVETELPGTSITFVTSAAATLVQAWWTVDLNVVGAVLTTAVVRPILDGVIQTQVQAILETPVAAAVGRWTLGNQSVYTVGPGSHTIALTGGANNAGNVQAAAGSSTIMVAVHG